VQKRPINEYDYDSPSLKFAYAGNMQKNKLHICGICSIYTPRILPNSTYFPTYFASKSSTFFKKILRYKPTSIANGNEPKITGVPPPD